MNKSFVELIAAYLTDSLTSEQEAVFIQMLEEEANREMLDQLMAEKIAEGALIGTEDIGRREKNLQALQERLHHGQPATVVKRQFPIYRKLWAAAAILLLLAAGTFFWLFNRPEKEPAMMQQVVKQSNITPGRNGALLVLSDGAKVVLDSLPNGELSAGNGVKAQLKNNVLTYAGGAGASGKNLLTTPKGRQFNVVLSDGTKVWLNAASSIAYPTAFTGHDRIVDITGEVYLEVATNPQQPFYVRINKQTTIQVLGTRFNVNAYADEQQIKTTLLQGSVKVISGADVKLLKPGEEAVITDGVRIQQANVAKAMAWKNGLFDLEGEDTAAFLRLLARWYDLDIVFHSQIPERKFHGKLGRDLQLSQVLDILSQFNIKYKLEGKILTIE